MKEVQSIQTQLPSYNLFHLDGATSAKLGLFVGADAVADAINEFGGINQCRQMRRLTSL